MDRYDPRVDAYIAKSPGFARPVLTHIRALIHRGCPEVEETLKWQFPHFMYKGILCGMGAFKEHCTLGFWKGRLVVGQGASTSREAMGHFGRITALADLPDDSTIIRLVKKAARLNDEGVKSPTRGKPKRKEPLRVPTYLTKVLKNNKKALATFKGFSYSKKREYVEWIVEARTEETRSTRMRTAIQWMAEGKSRNWKYAKRS
ncbi:MAG TPA: YdeI/OmpD-associated family protein [Bacteroidota bacterium]